MKSIDEIYPGTPALKDDIEGMPYVVMEDEKGTMTGYEPRLRDILHVVEVEKDIDISPEELFANSGLYVAQLIRTGLDELSIEESNPSKRFWFLRMLRSRASLNRADENRQIQNITRNYSGSGLSKVEIDG